MREEMNSIDSRRQSLRQRLMQVRDELPPHVTLIVVTKTFPASDVEILYQLGQRDFAENRVQELIAKRDELQGRIGADARWHYQGQIQSNKISSLNRYADVIHSLDSDRHIEKIDNSLEVLIQINLDRDSQESEGVRAGVVPDKSREFAARALSKFGEKFKGVMGVSPHHLGVTSQEKRQGFIQLRKVSEEILTFAPSARWISAGMSDDYRLAIAEGATHIRLGSSILGVRTPKN